MGSFGLAVFAMVACAGARGWPAAIVLVSAMAAWLVASVLLWAALVARRGEND